MWFAKPWGARVSRVNALAAALLVLTAGLILPKTAWYTALRERTFDSILAIHGRSPATSQVTVVDIDRASLERLGPWPWGRDRLAELVLAVGAFKPKAVAIDILLAGADEQSPAALARKLARIVDLPAVAALATTLPDGDARLKAAMTSVPVILGLALDPERETDGGAGRPIQVRGAFNAAALWQEPGFVGPPTDLADSATGIGALVLPGEADGAVRRVPMLVIAANRPVAGLALETLRVASGAALISVQDHPRQVRLGTRDIALDHDGMLRLLPPDLPQWARRTISATDVLSGAPGLAEALTGRAVIIGSSAPETGGLRPLPTGELAPTVQLHADALAQMMRGYVPRRPPAIGTLEMLGLVAAALISAFAGATLAPWHAACVTGAVVAAWMAIVVTALAAGPWLLDPILLPLVSGLGFIQASLLHAADAARRATAVRHRFEQHLSPAVVRQIVADPQSLKLKGEVRIVTALFTDVEGFTALTERAEPHQLIELLDAYFDGVIKLIVDHGGLVDKIVGDAVHALFNAPFDQAEHPRHALACARAVEAFAERFASTGLARDLGFGRTRIGIETGSAIVGDVGGTRKLDYTAHGNAVNAAARLEAANKVLGTTICLGPGIAAVLPAEQLRPLGPYIVRGRRELQSIFTIWPDDYSDAERRLWQQALAAPDRAIDLLAPLHNARPHDICLQRLLERLRMQAQ